MSKIRSWLFKFLLYKRFISYFSCCLASASLPALNELFSIPVVWACLLLAIKLIVCNILNKDWWIDSVQRKLHSAMIQTWFFTTFFFLLVSWLEEIKACPRRWRTILLSCLDYWLLIITLLLYSRMNKSVYFSRSTTRFIYGQINS